MLEILVIPILLSYVIVGVILMFFLRGISGVLATVVLGWMFLPPVRGVNLPGLPAYTKEYAISYALLIGLMLTGSERILRYRPHLADLAVMLWTIAPVFSSITNGLGLYDGISSTYSNLFFYAIPYFAARIYIRTPNDVRTVAQWFVIAGLIAFPFVVWESRMSPTLNRIIYGYDAAPFHATKRLGGYRPQIFMRHGLEVGLWMASSAVVSTWIMLTTPKMSIFGFNIRPATILILIANLLSRSLGALVLLFGNLAAGLTVRFTALKPILILLVLTPPLYLTVRYTNLWAPNDLTGIISAIDPQRADSLESRLNQELVIAKHALKKPLFGWGGHNRYRPINAHGEVEPVDGWTSITFGKHGLYGVTFLELTVTLPSFLLLLRLNRRDLTDPIWAPCIGVLLACSLFSLDILFNAFPTPLHFVGLGTLATAAKLARPWKRVIVAHRRREQAERRDSILAAKPSDEPGADGPDTPAPRTPLGHTAT